ncbi:hypothetical protein J4212_05135 [Candidatus Woesearchaeota archaeon]|nr:hypothetical protein [Candidatus Woesearchaeota archaeon]
MVGSGIFPIIASTHVGNLPQILRYTWGDSLVAPDGRPYKKGSQVVYYPSTLVAVVNGSLDMGEIIAKDKELAKPPVFTKVSGRREITDYIAENIEEDNAFIYKPNETGMGGIITKARLRQFDTRYSHLVPEGFFDLFLVSKEKIGTRTITGLQAMAQYPENIELVSLNQSNTEHNRGGPVFEVAKDYVRRMYFKAGESSNGHGHNVVGIYEEFRRNEQGIFGMTTYREFRPILKKNSHANVIYLADFVHPVGSGVSPASATNVAGAAKVNH